MRGGGRRNYGGRGSGRGGSGQFRSSIGNRLDSNRRGGGANNGGGGGRFDSNFYNDNRSGNHYSSYDRRNQSIERNSRVRDKSTNRRDAPTSRPTYRPAQRDRSYDGNKRLRENEHRSTRRGNRTPPPPSPPPPPISPTVHGNYRGSTQQSHLNKSNHHHQHHHHQQNQRYDTNNQQRGQVEGSGHSYRPAAAGATSTLMSSARARLSLKTSDLRHIRRRRTIYNNVQQKEIARSRKFRLTRELQRRRRLQRSVSGDAARNTAKSNESPPRNNDTKRESKKDDDKVGKEAPRKRKASTPARRAMKMRRSNSTSKEVDKDEKRSGTESDATTTKIMERERKRESSSTAINNNNNNNNNNNDKVVKKDTIIKVSRSSSSSKQTENGSEMRQEKKMITLENKKNNEQLESVDDKKSSSKVSDLEPSVKDLPVEDFKKQRVTKLTCVHCHMKCYSFKQYSDHLHSFKHKSVLQQINRRQRSYLLRLRARQRATQRDIEETNKEDFEPQFCNLCRLHYRLQKAKHQLSEHHKAMKKFLLPYCSVCRVSFKSPMSYEIHRCSIEHLRQKINRGTENSDSEQEGITRQIDLNNFLTVDSVGEIDGDLKMDDDGEEDDEVVEEDEEEENWNDEHRIESSDKKGVKYVKIVNAFHCELCATFEKAIGDLHTYAAKHCEGNEHKRRFEENQKMQKDKLTIEKKIKQVEKMPKKDKENNEAADEEEAEENEDEDDDEEEEVEAKATATVTKILDNNVQKENDESENEEKLWADVDKDIGDIFASVEGTNRDEDEEDESVLNIDLESDMLTNQEKKCKETTANKKEFVGTVVTTTPTSTATELATQITAAGTTNTSTITTTIAAGTTTTNTIATVDINDDKLTKDTENHKNDVNNRSVQSPSKKVKLTRSSNSSTKQK